MQSLEELVRSSEQRSSVLSFSEIEKAGQRAYGETIPFEKKPVQQFLATVKDSETDLDIVSQELVLQERESFNPQSDNKLIVDIRRIPHLTDSPRIYVNTDIFPSGLYKQALAQKMAIPDPTEKEWKQLATAVCHSQRIDYLVKYQKTANGEIVASLRTGKIPLSDPFLLLLSTPVLDFALDEDNLSKLNVTEISCFIERMYENLFSAVSSEGYKYIAMPAAGLGIHKGDPKQYFSALMKVAKNHPTLNIIYNPTKYEQEFSDALTKAADVTNVVTTTKDAFLVANALTEQKYPCAYHNTVDCSVIYGGINDRQTSASHNYIDDAYLNIMTSAPLNHHAFKLNERNEIKAEIIERDLWVAAEYRAHPDAMLVRSRNSQTYTVRDLLESSMAYRPTNILITYYSVLKHQGAAEASNYLAEDDGTRLKSAYIELMIGQLDDKSLSAIIPNETKRLNDVYSYLITQVGLLREQYKSNLDAAKKACQTESQQWKNFIVSHCVISTRSIKLRVAVEQLPQLI